MMIMGNKKTEADQNRITLTEREVRVGNLNGASRAWEGGDASY
jgi:hypothetical protein